MHSGGGSLCLYKDPVLDFISKRLKETTRPIVITDNGQDLKWPPLEYKLQGL
jgi:hypothetical protein